MYGSATISASARWSTAIPCQYATTARAGFGRSKRTSRWSSTNSACLPRSDFRRPTASSILPRPSGSRSDRGCRAHRLGSDDGRRAQDLARRRRDGRARAAHLRGRGARVSVPARRPRHHQGPPRRDARLPQELPDDDLRLLRDAHGRPGDPRLQGADEADRRGGPRPGHLGDGEPADREGPRRQHGSVLGQDPRRQALARPRLRRGRRARARHLAEGDERHPQGVALHHVRLLRLRVQRDGGRPGLPRPGRARQGDALRRRPARRGGRRAAERSERRARHLGLHAVLFLQRALPEGRRPARRDREARRGVDQARDRPRHGGEAREVVRHLVEDERLAARDRARPEDAGDPRRAQGDALRAEPRPPRQGAAAGADPRRGRGRRGARSLRPCKAAGTRRRRLRPCFAWCSRTGHPSALPGGSLKVAYYKGCLASLSAKELDSSTQALAPKLGLELEELESVTCCGAGDIHEAEPDYYLHLNARILAYDEQTGADTLMTICNVCTLNLRQASWQLKNDDELRARVNQNLETVGAPPYSGNVEVKHLLWLIAEGDGYDKLKEVAHKGLKGLKVAPFYGCQILRPSKILGFEDPDRPWSLEANL